jgi:hypothetical protein
MSATAQWVNSASRRPIYTLKLGSNLPARSMSPAQPPSDRTIDRRSTGGPPTRQRTLFLCVLAFWVVVPFAFLHDFGQDALPFVVVGQLARDHPSDVYPSNGDLYSPSSRFRDLSCGAAPAGTDCADLTVSFVSPPLVLPLAAPLGWLGSDGGVFLLRMVAALSLAGGMWILWARLTPGRPAVEGYLVAVALVLTPFVFIPLSLGQNAPLMFLSACLGTEDSDKPRRALAVAAVLSLTVAFKFSPLLLVLALVWQRRWKVIAMTAAMLAALAAFTVAAFPRQLFGDFLSASRSLSATAAANPYNGAIDANLHELYAPLVSSGFGSATFLVVRVVGAGLLFWFVGRRADADTQWAYAWVLLLLFVPLVWWHYLLVSIPAVVYAWRARARDSRWSDRSFLLVVGVAAATVPISIAYAQGSSWPMVQAAYLLGVVALVPLLLRWRAPARATPAPFAVPSG